MESSPADRRNVPRHIAGKPTFYKDLLRRLERPMLLLSFVWFLVIIAELTYGLNPLLLNLGTSLWALLVVHFALRLGAAPDRIAFLKRNGLFVLAILVPVLRLFRFLQALPLVRVLTATFGLQVVWILASADQGLKSLRRSMGRRGAGYALTFTMLVILAGGAGMLHFEKGAPGPQGIHSYPKALWWVAMQITNIGSGYQPVTHGGLLLCLGISVFAAAIFGYLTAVFATVFIGRDAEDPKSGIPNQTSINQLSNEVVRLRIAIEEVLRRVPGPTHPSVDAESSTKEPSPTKSGKIHGTIP